MNRIQQPWAEDIVAAFEITESVGINLRSVHFLCGVDPIYAGLHGFEVANHARSYRDIAHCAFECHTSDRSTTVVLPHPFGREVVLHELGHVLDERQGFRWSIPAVSEYAALNRYEAFAEAFAIWLGDRRFPYWPAALDQIMRWECSPESIFAP